MKRIVWHTRKKPPKRIGKRMGRRRLIQSSARTEDITEKKEDRPKRVCLPDGCC